MRLAVGDDAVKHPHLLCELGNQVTVLFTARLRFFAVTMLVVELDHDIILCGVGEPQLAQRR